MNFTTKHHRSAGCLAFLRSISAGGRVGSRLRQILVALSIGTALVSSAAVADPILLPPVVETPGSNAALGGPSVWDRELSPFGLNKAWDPNQEETALSQRSPDPEFLAKGIPLGDFRLYPDLTSSVSYDDNIFRFQSPRHGGGVFTETPSMVLDYTVNEAQVDFFSDGTFSQYPSYSHANSDQYDAGIRANYQISHALQASSNISYSQLIEPLGTPDGLGTAQEAPVGYHLFDGSGQVSYQRGRIGLMAGGSADSYTYFSTPLIGGGEVNQADQNRWIYTGVLQSDYQIYQSYTVFARGTYDADVYEQYYDRNGTHRSSDGYQAYAGLQTFAGDLLQVELLLGYLEQHYDSHQKFPLHDVGGIDFGANISWYPTEDITVQLNASKQLEDTILSGAAAGNDRNVNLVAIYALNRRIDVSASIAYDDTDFAGTMPLQDDQTLTAGLKVKWLVSRFVTASASYQRTQRDSSLPGGGFQDNLMSLQVDLKV